jgi:hypothetical protein
MYSPVGGGRTISVIGEGFMDTVTFQSPINMALSYSCTGKTDTSGVYASNKAITWTSPAVSQSTTSCILTVS